MKTWERELEAELFALQDLNYRAFHASLMPTVSAEVIIGVRVPVLRRLAKELAKRPYAEEFLTALPHRYYEENNLHAFLIAGMKDANAVLVALDAFLPYIDNWATCDMLRPKAFIKHPPQLIPKIREWLDSRESYTVRFGIGMLMSYYLGDAFSPGYPAWVAAVHSEEYYVKMMIAWYFATALAAQYDEIIPYLQEQRLDAWTHNKTIQKAIESYRITEEQKKYLRTLKVKLPRNAHGGSV